MQQPKLVVSFLYKQLQTNLIKSIHTILKQTKHTHNHRQKLKDKEKKRECYKNDDPVDQRVNSV